MKQSVAARRRGVATSTLSGRLNGRRERHEAHAHEQLLSEEEEAELKSWCLQMQLRFLPVRLPHVIGCAESILRRRIGDTEPDVHVGKHWIERFLMRHPELRVTTSKRLDERRAMAKNPVNIMEFYVMLSNVYEKYGILPKNIFNMDEKGYMLGMIGKEKVVILRRGHRDGYAGGAKHNGNRETITTIDGICGDGTVLPTMIIMKGIYVQTTWLEYSPLEPETRWACSPTGWTNNKLGVEYIKAFDKWTQDKLLGGQWRCLILDGHGSHLTFEFLQYAWDARIIIVGLPSHTTDFLQPLDVALFRPMQRFYGQAVENRAQRMLAVTKASFAKLLHEARQKAYTRENILSGFEATGIYPLDAYRTQVMQNFQAKMRAANQTPASSEETQPALRRCRRRRALTAKAQDLVDNKESSPEELRNALAAALEVIDGVEARAVILETDLQQLREALHEKTKRKPRGTRMGRARVYEQKEIETVRREEESRAQARGSITRGRARGRGQNRGRGGRGGQQNVRGNNILRPESAQSESSEQQSDVSLESEDSA